MTGQIIYSLTVPSTPESLTVLEGLCETFITASDTVPPEIALIIRLSVAEACRNALVQRNPAGGLQLTKLTFLRIGEPGIRGIALEIEDTGLGVPVEGNRPPYPEEMAGQEFPFSGQLGERVVAVIESPTSIRLMNQDISNGKSRDDLIAGASDHGLGTLALCRCWHVVRYTWAEGKGTTLRLERPNLEL